MSVACVMEVQRCGWTFFVFKQKAAYEMRISDWSADVCSSDLRGIDHHAVDPASRARLDLGLQLPGLGELGAAGADRGRGAEDHGEQEHDHHHLEIGRAACRARMCQNV